MTSGGAGRNPNGFVTVTLTALWSPAIVNRWSPAIVSADMGGGGVNVSCRGRKWDSVTAVDAAMSG